MLYIYIYIYTYPKFLLKKKIPQKKENRTRKAHVIRLVEIKVVDNQEGSN